MKRISNFLFALLPAFSSAAVFMEIIDQHPNHPGQCLVDGIAHPLEATWDASSAATSTCQRKSCTSYNNENQLLVITSTCPSVAAESPCYLVEDKEASYPDCCPRFECPTVIDEAAETSNAIVDEENRVNDLFAAIMDYDANDVTNNEIQDGSDVIDNIMMESRVPEPVRIMLPPPENYEATADYDVILGEGDDVTGGSEGDYSDIFLQSPFRGSMPSIGSGKPIVQFRR